MGEKGSFALDGEIESWKLFSGVLSSAGAKAACLVVPAVEGRRLGFAAIGDGLGVDLCFGFLFPK